MFISSDQPAELFIASGIGRKAAILKYQRFERFADALRHAVETVGLAKFPGTVIEIGEQRLNSLEIAEHYAGLLSPKPNADNEEDDMR
jgi:hypothetical protein